MSKDKLIDKEVNVLARYYALQGIREGEALGHQIGERIEEEVGIALAAEALAAMEHGKSFEEWFYSEDPDVRFLRLLKASSAPSWLIERMMA